MKKGVGTSILTSLFALLMIIMIWSVLAVPTPAKASTVTYTEAGRMQQAVSKRQAVAIVRRRRHVGQYHFGPPQQNNQIFSGNSNTGSTTYFIGRNQGNNGNPGYNFGRSQNNSLNSGNQLLNQRTYRQNNQFFFGNGDSFDRTYYSGYNQGNFGNPGYNRGDNEDNSTNAGNQIIN